MYLNMCIIKHFLKIGFALEKFSVLVIFLLWELEREIAIFNPCLQKSIFNVSLLSWGLCLGNGLSPCQKWEGYINVILLFSEHWQMVLSFSIIIKLKSEKVFEKWNPQHCGVKFSQILVKFPQMPWENLKIPRSGVKSLGVATLAMGVQKPGKPTGKPISQRIR